MSVLVTFNMGGDLLDEISHSLFGERPEVGRSTLKRRSACFGRYDWLCNGGWSSWNAPLAEDERNRDKRP